MAHWAGLIPALGSRQPSRVHNQRWHGTPLLSSSPSEVAWHPWSLWAAVGSSNECCIVTAPWSAPAIEWDLQTKKIHIAWKMNFIDATTQRVWSAAILKYLWFFGGHKKQLDPGFLCRERLISMPSYSQTIDPPTPAWQTNGPLQTYQENLTPNSTFTLFYTKGTKWKNLDLNPPPENFNPTEASQMLIHPCLPWYQRVAWNSFSSILMESCSQSRLSCLSHTLQMCSDERASVCPACSCPQGARCRCHILSYNLHLSFLDHTLR